MRIDKRIVVCLSPRGFRQLFIDLTARKEQIARQYSMPSGLPCCHQSCGLPVGLGGMCSKNFQLCILHCLHVFHIMLVKIGNYAQKMLITVQINTF